MNKEIETIDDEIREWQAIWMFYLHNDGVITQHINAYDDSDCYDRVFDSGCKHRFRDIIVLVDGKKTYYINSKNIKLVTREIIDGKKGTAP